MLQGPSTEDRKLHSEVNQIVNQRFQLATIAITIFGVVVAWLLPRQTPVAGTPLGAFTFAVPYFFSSFCLLSSFFVGC